MKKTAVLTVLFLFAAVLALVPAAQASYLYVKEAQYRTEKLARAWDDYSGYNVGRCSRFTRHRVVCDVVMFRRGEQCLYRSRVTRQDLRRGAVRTSTRFSYVWCEGRSHGGGS